MKLYKFLKVMFHKKIFKIIIKKYGWPQCVIYHIVTSSNKMMILQLKYVMKLYNILFNSKMNLIVNK